MEYRLLGKTDLRVSPIGFGAATLGGVFGNIDEADALRSVHAAFDAGINLVDVAPYYGITKAETVLGRALKGVVRDRYVLSTKVGRYGPNDFDFSAERVTRSIDESLSRLGVEHIDLIHCHDIEFVDIAQIVQETLPCLRKIQQSGKIRYISVSGLPLAIYPRVLDAAPLDAVLSYCHYTLFDQTLDALVPALSERNVGLINASPLSMGLLADAPPPPWHPAPQPIQDACARAAAFCRERGADIAELGLQFAFTNPNVASTLVGMASVELVHKNLALLGTPPDPTLLAEVQAILAPIHNQSWPSGIPENNIPLSEPRSSQGKRGEE